ncbi:hypothetical protein ACGFIF_29295 [Kribbella sp. NPDC049174]|uniref:hypothetical protein n=1 Tax=Kribbella sp. NPDC049174 TaxID=3364112 RepID=UPI003711B089
MADAQTATVETCGDVVADADVVAVDDHESASVAIRLAQRVATAVAEKRSAEDELSVVKVPERVSAADIRKMVHELGDM